MWSIVAYRCPCVKQEPINKNVFLLLLILDRLGKMLTGLRNLSQVQLMGDVPVNLQSRLTCSPARIFISSGNCRI